MKNKKCNLCKSEYENELLLFEAKNVFICAGSLQESPVNSYASGGGHSSYAM